MSTLHALSLLRKARSTIATRSTKAEAPPPLESHADHSRQSHAHNNHKTITTPLPTTPNDEFALSRSNSTNSPTTTTSSLFDQATRKWSKPGSKPRNPSSTPLQPPVAPSASAVGGLRRRLTRKASTFTLRRRRHKVDSKSHSEPRQDSQDLLQYRDPPSHSLTLDPLQAQTTKAVVDSGFKSIHPRASTSTSSLSTVRPACISAGTVIDCGPQEEKDILAEVQAITSPSRIKGLRGGAVNHPDQEVHPWVKVMASDHASPPVPYTRLKEITESACEAALSGVTSYSHADTERWNTTIINSILGALVQETTQQPSASTSNSTSPPPPAQPNFKYVVNSTIIQHASSSSTTGTETEVKKLSGRRGMHAASGAYWNNEKDGMWSFKYPGADSKGLDVVVGIIWVWVG
ncbi:hypothetical protein B0A52_05573 [Exophiala mesophila]|uniref:Topoisomerase I damage affected protein 2 n=1 Tax=Exophiala mesophila TaxID=212818 RepID=A0A438N3B9_EXOME|nr:hypothetical protein B0A52_05573 [Exophiala mesophila]